MPSSAPSQDGTLIGQRQLSSSWSSGPESSIDEHRVVPGRPGGGAIVLDRPLVSMNVPFGTPPSETVAVMAALLLSSRSR